MGRSNPSRETNFSGANGDRENLIFPVQLTTSRIGDLTPLILLLPYQYAITIHSKHMYVCIERPNKYLLERYK